MLKNFTINTQRDLLAPDFECYQMGLMGPVNKAIAAGEVDEEFKLLPSWRKFGANPIKSKGFFVRVLEALFLGKGHDELNVELQAYLDGPPEQRVAMMFLSANKQQALMAGKIAEQVLPAYNVIVLNGDAVYKDKKINNRNAEHIVQEVVKEGKPTLIISNMMAQRSFSIPEITELYLAYDKGANGATIQKMSRTLTPNDVNKVGKIFSLSFDPNRDDKFDAMVVETALNYKKRHDVKSLREAMREVLRTIDIFSCQEGGAIKIDVDLYLKCALARKGISRVLGNIVDLTTLDGDIITALANGNNDYFRAATQEKAKTGKTRDAKQVKVKSTNVPDASKKVIAKARETIVQIVENMDVIMQSSKSKLISDALVELNNASDKEWVLDEFGVELKTIHYLFESNIIRQDWVELIHES